MTTDELQTACTAQLVARGYEVESIRPQDDDPVRYRITDPDGNEQVFGAFAVDRNAAGKLLESMSDLPAENGIFDSEWDVFAEKLREILDFEYMARVSMRTTKLIVTATPTQLATAFLRTMTGTEGAKQ